MSDFIARFGRNSIYMKDDFEVHETDLFVKGIKNKLTLHLYSDIHIAFTDRRDNLARRNFVMQRRIFFPGAPDVLEQAVTFNRKNKKDFTILLGDIIDFPSDKNLEMLSALNEEGFGPYLYHLGNHDDNFPLEKATPEEKDAYRKRIDCFARDKLNVFRDVTPEICLREPNGFHAVDLGEIIVAGGDDVTAAGIGSIKKGLTELAAIDKPVILCVHLPFHSEELDPVTANIWGRCSSLKNIDEYLECNKNIIAAFAGDVHFFFNTMAGGKIPEIVTTSTETKIQYIDHGKWPFYYSGMSIVNIIPEE